MSLTRTLALAALALHTFTGHSNWTPLTVGGTGSRSITTFNGSIYVATPNTGVRKSAIGSGTWTLVNTGLPANGANYFVQSVGHSNTALFCGTESGVYRSTDNAASWVSVNGVLPIASPSVYCNKIYSFGGGTFVVYTGLVSQNGGGVFRTFDDGGSWLQAFSGLSGNMTIYNIDEMGGVLYASTSTALMKSSDLGQSWTMAGTSNFAFYAVQGVGNRLVGITTFGCQWSTNGGTTWSTASSSNYPVSFPAAGSELIAYDGKYFAITSEGSLGCYRSLDGGATWTAFNTGLSAQNTFAQEEFHAGGETLYIACLFDSHSTPGSTVGLEEPTTSGAPTPYPTAFTEGFSIDLSDIPADRALLILDAAGREVARHPNMGGGVRSIERGGLVAGRYHCFLLDPNTGSLLDLGSIVAQ